MSSRSVRTPTLLVVTVAAALLVAVGASAPAGARAGGGVDRVLEGRCLRAALGAGVGAATPMPGSADPGVVAQLAIFRAPRTSADALPAAVRLGRTLADAGARTYDPAASVLFSATAAPGGVYVVPATLALPNVPARCATLPHLGGIGAVAALRAQSTGTGPGVCLVSTQTEPGRTSFPTLPGKAHPRPAKPITVAGAQCESDAVLSGYPGALGEALPGSTGQLAVVPDGVSTITYALADGRQLTVPVSGNLAAVPSAALVPTTSGRTTIGTLRRLLAAHLPTTITESGPGAVPVQTLARPPALIPAIVGDVRLLRGLLSLGGTSTVVGSSDSTEASCSARTHRCVAVTVSTTCDTPTHCVTKRTIHRYRYVGAKPPRGTTAPVTLPTAPIRGRVSRYLAHPGKLSLVLSGGPHHAVTVLESVTCVTHGSHGSLSIFGGPTLHVAVPSRTPITLPGRTGSRRGCDVGALVISPQRGRVRVRVMRG